LTLARAGRQIDDLEAVRLNDVIQHAWETVETANATLTVDCDRTIVADPTMLQHVFENLFKNAIDHGGEEVEVTVGTLDAGFYVEDDGAGIPPDERDAVFEVGYTGEEDGTGFGLSIIKQIVSAHDWEIHLHEGTDGGARFEITGIDGVE
jgi:signal transduction histidine kinase